MKFERVKAGDTVFHVGKTKMGNTTLSTVSIWEVRIIAVDPETRTVTASWNGNSQRRYTEGQIRAWRAKRPELESTGVCGQRRIAKRKSRAASGNGAA